MRSPRRSATMRPCPCRSTRATAPSAAREATIAAIALLVAALVTAGWLLDFHLRQRPQRAAGPVLHRGRPLRRPGATRHPEGLLFVTVGVLHTVMFFGRQYGSHPVRCPGAEWIGWVGVWPVPS